MATSSKPFIEQIPKRHLKMVRTVEALGFAVAIHWTNAGWKYTITNK